MNNPHESLYLQTNFNQTPYHASNTQERISFYQDFNNAPTNFNGRDVNNEERQLFFPEKTVYQKQERVDSLPLNLDNLMTQSFIEGKVAHIRPMMRRSASPLATGFPPDKNEDQFMTFGTMTRIATGTKKYARQKHRDDEYIQSKHENFTPNRQIWPSETNTNKIIDENAQLVDRIYQLREKNDLFCTEKQQVLSNNDDNEIDEIIEEVITTTKLNPFHQPSPIGSPSPNFPPVSATKLFSSPPLAKISYSIGVGDGDINQYYLLDTGSTSINPASFPPAYWERLSRYFSEHILRKRIPGVDIEQQLSGPSYRTTFSSARSNQPRLSNFGVNVKPNQDNVGIGTETISQKDQWCMTEDLDEYFARLLCSLSSKYPNADSEFIRQLYRHSRTDVSEFIRRLLTRLSELKTPPELPKSRMESVGCNVRPQMTNKRTSSMPPRLINSGVNTDGSIQRTQGMMHVPLAPDRVDIGSATSSFIKTMDNSSQVSQPSVTQNTNKANDEDNKTSTRSELIGVRKLTTCRVKQSLHRSGSRKPSQTSEDVTESSYWSHAPDSRMMPSSEDNILNGAALDSPCSSNGVTGDRQESISPVSRQQTSFFHTRSPTFSLNMQPVSEVSGRHIPVNITQPSTVKVDWRVINHNNIIDDKQRTRDWTSNSQSSSTGFLKSSEVKHVVNAPQDRFNRSRSDHVHFGIWDESGNPANVESRNDERVLQFPSNLQTQVTRHSDTLETHHSSTRQPDNLSQRISGFDPIKVQIPEPEKIPLRNYSFKVTKSVNLACETLASWYLSSTESTPPPEMQEHMTLMRQVWFDLMSQKEMDVHTVEDLFAFLYNCSPELLYLFTRMSSSNGSTCLHYAVGHGAWRVVSLILDTKYADPDKINTTGFSPIMIAAISGLVQKSVVNQLAIEVINRLFSVGNVNLRAETETCQTPLILAARKTNTTIVSLLLRHGADVNARDKAGNTPLMCAVTCGHLEVVRLLLARSELDLDLKDKEDKTALDIAEQEGNQQIIQLIRERMSDFSANHYLQFQQRPSTFREHSFVFPATSKDGSRRERSFTQNSNFQTSEDSFSE